MDKLSEFRGIFIEPNFFTSTFTIKIDKIQIQKNTNFK